jgi:hypothetical protein
MGISKEEREAYENGREEAEFIRDHPFIHLLTGGIHSRPSDPNKGSAYDKGLKEEQFDKD